MSEISQRDAEGKLAKAVADFDWIENFLGGKRNEFLERYLALSRQLKKGDRLEIEIVATGYRIGYGATVTAPTFSIVLHTKDGQRKAVSSYDKDGYSGKGELLYQD